MTRPLFIGPVLDLVTLAVCDGATVLTLELPLGVAERVLADLTRAVAEARAWRLDEVPDWLDRRG